MAFFRNLLSGRGGVEDAPTDVDSNSSSDDDDNADALLAKANSAMKPGVGDRAFYPSQQYAYSPITDLSEGLLLKNKSRYMFLKSADGRGLLVQYVGAKAALGRHTGDLFMENTLRRCHLSKEETRVFEKKFMIAVDMIIRLDNESQRSEARERLATYFLLLESNIFSRGIDIEDKAERQKFIYECAMVRSPLDKRSVARKFKREIVNRFGDTGLLTRVETVASRPKPKKKPQTTRDLMQLSSKSGFDIVKFSPKKKEEEEEMTVAEALRATENAGFDIVKFSPKKFISPSSADDKEEEEETTLDLLKQTTEGGFEIVKFSPQPRREAEMKEELEEAATETLDSEEEKKLLYLSEVKEAIEKTNRGSFEIVKTEKAMETEEGTLKKGAALLKISSSGGKSKCLVLSGALTGKEVTVSDEDIKKSERTPERLEEKLGVKGIGVWKAFLAKTVPAQSGGIRSYLPGFPGFLGGSSTDSTPKTPNNTEEPEAKSQTADPGTTAEFVTTEDDSELTLKKKLAAVGNDRRKLQALAKTVGVPANKKSIIIEAGIRLLYRLERDENTQLGVLTGNQDVFTKIGGQRIGQITKGTIVVCLGKKEDEYCKLVSVDPRKDFGVYKVRFGTWGEKIEQTVAFYIKKSGLTGTYVKHDFTDEEKSKLIMILFRGEVGKRGVDKWNDAKEGVLVYKDADEATPAAPAAAPAAPPEAPAEAPVEAPAEAPAEASAEEVASDESADYKVGEIVNVRNKDGTIRFNKSTGKNWEFIIKSIKGDKMKVAPIKKSGDEGKVKVVDSSQAVRIDGGSAPSDSGGGLLGGIGSGLSSLAQGITGAARVITEGAADAAGTAVSNVTDLAAGSDEQEAEPEAKEEAAPAAAPSTGQEFRDGDKVGKLVGKGKGKKLGAANYKVIQYNPETDTYDLQTYRNGKSYGKPKRGVPAADVKSKSWLREGARIEVGDFLHYNDESEMMMGGMEEGMIEE